MLSPPTLVTPACPLAAAFRLICCLMFLPTTLPVPVLFEFVLFCGTGDKGAGATLELPLTRLILPEGRFHIDSLDTGS